MSVVLFNKTDALILAGPGSANDSISVLAGSDPEK
jgi:hypothetical protein